MISFFLDWFYFFLLLWLGNSMGIPNPILYFTSNDSLDHKSCQYSSDHLIYWTLFLWMLSFLFILFITGIFQIFTTRSNNKEIFKYNKRSKTQILYLKKIISPPTFSLVSNTLPIYETQCIHFSGRNVRYFTRKVSFSQN